MQRVDIRRACAELQGVHDDARDNSAHYLPASRSPGIPTSPNPDEFQRQFANSPKPENSQDMHTFCARSGSMARRGLVMLMLIALVNKTCSAYVALLQERCSPTANGAPQHLIAMAVLQTADSSAPSASAQSRHAADVGRAAAPRSAAHNREQAVRLRMSQHVSEWPAAAAACPESRTAAKRPIGRRHFQRNLAEIRAAARKKMIKKEQEC